MKVLSARMIGRVQGLIPRSALLTWWKHRNIIFTVLILVIGMTWMISGALFREPLSVLFGFGLIAPFPWWVGYRVLVYLQARRAARAPAPKPAESEDEEEKPSVAPS